MNVILMRLKLSETIHQDLLQQANQAYHTEINDLLLTALAYALQDWHGEYAKLCDARRSWAGTYQCR